LKLNVLTFLFIFFRVALPYFYSRLLCVTTPPLLAHDECDSPHLDKLTEINSVKTSWWRIAVTIYLDRLLFLAVLQPYAKQQNAITTRWESTTTIIPCTCVMELVIYRKNKITRTSLLSNIYLSATFYDLWPCCILAGFTTNAQPTQGGARNDLQFMSSQPKNTV